MSVISRVRTIAFRKSTSDVVIVQDITLPLRYESTARMIFPVTETSAARVRFTFRQLIFSAVLFSMITPIILSKSSIRELTFVQFVRGVTIINSIRFFSFTSFEPGLNKTQTNFVCIISVDVTTNYTSWPSKSGPRPSSIVDQTKQLPHACIGSYAFLSVDSSPRGATLFKCHINNATAWVARRL